MSLLKDKVAIVTGGNGGIGLGIAEGLADQGATIIIAARNEEKNKDAIKKIKLSSKDSETFKLDVNDQDSINSLMEFAIEKYGKIDILINNAGINRDSLSIRMSQDQWDEVIQLNLNSTFQLSQLVVKSMIKERWGRIIGISSIIGLGGNIAQSNYSASKAGLIGLTRSLSRELAGRKVTVNAVAPGFIESDMTAALGDMVINEPKKRIPAKRLGTAEDVAAAVLFLAGDAAAYVTGHVLTVDGGMTG